MLPKPAHISGRKRSPEPVILDQIPYVAPQRAKGALRITARADASGVTRIGALRQEGALRAFFPRQSQLLQALLINTAGGATGGDRFEIDAHAEPGAHLRLTTQAAERAYRALPGEQARIRNRLSVAEGARLDWLPQETILYETCDLDRTLRVDLAADARALIVEPVIFGRAAMGEQLRSARFRDRIEIRRDGRPIYLDAMRFKGDVTAHLAHPAVADGAAAMACVLLADPCAETHLGPLRAMLPDTAGASLLQPDFLAIRLLAADGHDLRRSLLPVLDRLTGGTLPSSWRL